MIKRGACSFISVLIATLAFLATPVRADTYPSHPIKLIVPFPPGGSSDLLARVVAKELTQALDQSVIVENHGGGGTIIGTDIVAKSRPDGYTLAWITTPLAINVTLKKHLSYDAARDFIPIVMVASVPLVVMVKPAIPVHTVAELVRYAKQHPGKLSYGSSGPGGTPHLAAEKLKSEAGIDMVHVPYQGSGPVLTALMGGYVDVVIEAQQSSAPLIRSNKARALATTGSTRPKMFPNLPTMIEAGYPDYTVSTWFGLAVPAGVSMPIVETLNQKVNAILKKPEIEESLHSQGFELIGGSQADAKAFIANEVAKWRKVVIAAHAVEND